MILIQNQLLSTILQHIIIILIKFCSVRFSRAAVAPNLFLNRAKKVPYYELYEIICIKNV